MCFSHLSPSHLLNIFFVLYEYAPAHSLSSFTYNIFTNDANHRLVYNLSSFNVGFKIKVSLCSHKNMDNRVILRYIDRLRFICKNGETGRFHSIQVWSVHYTINPSIICDISPSGQPILFLFIVI